MSSQRQVPPSLGVVAILFLLSGVGSGIAVVLALLRGELSLNFGVLGIPIFFGLRAFSPGWRKCAIVFLWIGLIASYFVFLIGLFGRVPATFDVFGQRIADIPSYWASVVAVPFFALILWQFRVLTRPDIRVLFEASGPTTGISNA